MGRGEGRVRRSEKGQADGHKAVRFSRAKEQQGAGETKVESGGTFTR